VENEQTATNTINAKNNNEKTLPKNNQKMIQKWPKFFSGNLACVNWSKLGRPATSNLTTATALRQLRNQPASQQTH
jgi:hypothetical protein